jgi:hypothetical protein
LHALSLPVDKMEIALTSAARLDGVEDELHIASEIPLE